MIKRQNGVVIVAVLWVCALIMWIALQIGTESRLKGEEEVHLLRRSQALHLAIGGAYEALARMGQPISLEAGDVDDENWQPDGSAHLVNYLSGQTLVLIEKETNKVNVNEADHEQLKAVLIKAGVEEDASDVLADVIADFIDKDDLTRLHGAEKDEYVQMGLHYPPFNGPLLSLDQMILIPGISEQLFFGNLQKVTDAETGESETVRDPALPGKYSLFQMLTVYGNNQVLSEEESTEPTEPENITWEADQTYRILSCGKLFSGPPAVLLWLIVRYAPQSEKGYEVLYRKIL